jgi:hypothetical protein
LCRCSYHIWTWERLERVLMPACSAVKGHPVRTCVVVLDLAGLSLKQFNMTTKRLLTAIAKIDQVRYPMSRTTCTGALRPLTYAKLTPARGAGAHALETGTRRVCHAIADPCCGVCL